MKLGSLFDGIGGFPYSAQRHGITPVWASEIEPACISITKRHFPDMAHLGDITAINGAEIEPVDVITFGSPCQDLSVAGKRAGLDGARSGLFSEAIRIINEMRSKTNGLYPAFAVWENVPGALSSNKGLDFKAVLEAFATSAIPMPASGKWAGAGMVRGGGCNFAWRVLDAQYWGVPQRRRRVFLVADFRGQRAAEILFKPESLRGNTAPGGTPGQEAAPCAGNGAAWPRITGTLCASGAGLNRVAGQENETDLCIVYPDKARTLAARHDSSPCIDRGQNFVVCAAFMGGQGDKARGIGYAEEQSPTLKASPSGGNTAPTVIFENYRHAEFREGIGPLRASGGIRSGDSGNLCVTYQQVTGTFSPGSHPGSYNGQDAKNDMLVSDGYIVRRLTPVECERLQGFPDGWTEYGADGKPIADSKRYSAIGNSVAIPCVDYIMAGLSAEHTKEV